MIQGGVHTEALSLWLPFSAGVRVAVVATAAAAAVTPEQEEAEEEEEGGATAVALLLVLTPLVNEAVTSAVLVVTGGGSGAGWGLERPGLAERFGCRERLFVLHNGQMGAFRWMSCWHA